MWSRHKHIFSLRAALLYLALLLIMLVGHSNTLKGQFMRMEIMIEELFSIFVENPMSFGTVQPNRGWVTLQIHDSGTGQVGITAKENIALHVIIEAPSELILDESNSLPFRLETAYLQDGSTNLQQAIPFLDNIITFQLSGSGLLVNKMDPGQFRLRADVYFFGQVFTGDISPGIYSGTIGVRVEYN